jgi:ferrous iron transport protein A
LIIEYEKSYKVVGYNCTKELRKKYASLGLIKGSVFKYVRSAPLGDPIQLNVKGSNLSIRREDLNLLNFIECI